MSVGLHSVGTHPVGLDITQVASSATGTIAATLDGVTMAASGTVQNTGTITSTLAGVTLAASGISGDNATGTIASTLAGVTMMATGQSDTPIVMTGAIMRRRARPRIPPKS